METGRQDDVVGGCRKSYSFRNGDIEQRAVREERTLAGGRYREEANLAALWVYCEMWTLNLCKSRSSKQLAHQISQGWGSPEAGSRFSGSSIQDAFWGRGPRRDKEEGERRQVGGEDGEATGEATVLDPWESQPPFPGTEVFP